MTVIQWISIGGSLCFMFIVFFAIYHNKLREGYALLWIAATVGLIVLSIVPRLLNWAAHMVGIQTPAFFLMLFLNTSMILVLFQQSVIISSHNEKIKRLTEELTLLRSEQNKRDRE